MSNISLALLFGLEKPVTYTPPNLPPRLEIPKTVNGVRVCHVSLDRGYETLERVGPCTVSTLAKHAGWSKTHTGYVLRTLLELGFVTREMTNNKTYSWKVVPAAERQSV